MIEYKYSGSRLLVEVMRTIHSKMPFAVIIHGWKSSLIYNAIKLHEERNKGLFDKNVKYSLIEYFRNIFYYYIGPSFWMIYGVSLDHGYGVSYHKGNNVLVVEFVQNSRNNARAGGETDGEL